jgi:hypothetical protein
VGFFYAQHLYSLDSINQKKGRLTRPFFLPTQALIRAYSLLCAPSQKGWLAVILQPQKYTVLFSVAVNATGENGLP